MCYQTFIHKEAFAMTSIAQISENEQSEICHDKHSTDQRK